MYWQGRARKREQKRLIQIFLVVIGAALLSAALYFIYTKSDGLFSGSSLSDTTVVDATVVDTSSQAKKSSDAANRGMRSAAVNYDTPVVRVYSDKQPANDEKASEEKSLVSSTAAERVKTSNNSVGAGNPPGTTRYKVKSIAYFHDAPDERTRRSAFINHWNNSYATLIPLDEKNGFIYIVFKNHLGQTTKGWLRIADLRPIGARQNGNEK